MMKPNKITRLSLLAFSLIFILSACSKGADKKVSSEPAAIGHAPIVSATGEVIPFQEALLSIPAGGVIENVLFSKGDEVSAGQVLVKLEGTEKQRVMVSVAELELLNAKMALESLYKDTDLLTAEALRSVEMAEQALEDLNNSELQQARALQAVAQAEKALEIAERDLTTLTNFPTQNVIAVAYANMLLAENKLNKTLEQIEDVESQLIKYSKIPSVKKRLSQALKGLEIQRSQDQLDYNNSQTRYNNLLEPPDAIDVEVAEAEFSTSRAQLLQAERDLERVLDGPDAGEVALLKAKIDTGYRDFETYSAGPDPDDIIRAETRIMNAAAQLAAAMEILADLELVAPFDGTISEVHINPGEWVAPGSPVLLIADLEHLQIETTDLSEVDVARIMIGDTATVTFDALPEWEIRGTITRISPKALPGSGVYYPVIIELDEIPAGLRWGMTAFVDVGGKD